jgi:hypothetical protein
MKYNIGDIVFLKQSKLYAYILRIENDILGVDWYTLKYQTPQRFGGSLVPFIRYNTEQMMFHVDKVP